VANRLAMEAPAPHAGTLNRTAGTP
jgi:hypothetical protein